MTTTTTAATSARTAAAIVRAVVSRRLVFAAVAAAAAPATASLAPGRAAAQATPAATLGAGMAMEGDMGMSGTGAAYMTIRNGGAEPDRLVAGETAVAEVVEIHEIVEQEGVMEMRPLAEGLEVPAGGEVLLEPGGYHVMLIGLTEDLRNGMTFDLTLRFETAGEVVVPVRVRPRAELADEATPVPPTTLGDLSIEGVWSRPAPAFGGGMGMATPAATPTTGG